MQPNAQELTQSLAQNEVQLAAGMGGGGARVIQHVSTAPASDQEQFRQMQRKVLYLAVALASMLAFERFIMYVFNVAEMEAAIHEIKEVVPDDINLRFLPDDGAMVVRGFPKMVFGIIGALIVPACGIFGARQSNPKLMCCFSGCNLLAGCMSILSIIFLTTAVMVVSGVEPVVAEYLETCDPGLCTQPQLSHNETIDCLAAPAAGYAMQFANSPHLSDKCPPLFLRCKVDPAWIRYCSLKRDHFDCAKGSKGKCAWMDLGSEPSCVPADLTAIADKIEHYVEKPGRALMAAPSLLHEHHQQYRMQRSVGEDFAMDGAAKTKGWPISLPENPQTDCEVDNKRVEAYHAVRKLEPRLVPMVIGLMMIRLVLTIPMAILSCLGFIWGKDLHSKLSSGYVHMGAPTYVGQPQSVQPAQQAQPMQSIAGHNAPAPSAVMVQPMVAQSMPVAQASAPAMDQAASPTTAVIVSVQPPADAPAV